MVLVGWWVNETCIYIFSIKFVAKRPHNTHPCVHTHTYTHKSNPFIYLDERDLAAPLGEASEEELQRQQLVRHA